MMSWKTTHKSYVHLTEEGNLGVFFFRRASKIRFFCGVTLRLPLNTYRRFEGKLRHLLQGQAFEINFSLSLSPPPVFLLEIFYSEDEGNTIF